MPAAVAGHCLLTQIRRFTQQSMPDAILSTLPTREGTATGRLSPDACVLIRRNATNVLPKAENPQQAGSYLMCNRLMGEGVPDRNGQACAVFFIALVCSENTGWTV